MSEPLLDTSERGELERQTLGAKKYRESFVRHDSQSMPISFELTITNRSGAGTVYVFFKFEGKVNPDELGRQIEMAKKMLSDETTVTVKALGEETQVDAESLDSELRHLLNRA
jgi:hypothetical protein